MLSNQLSIGRYVCFIPPLQSASPLCMRSVHDKIVSLSQAIAYEAKGHLRNDRANTTDTGCSHPTNFIPVWKRADLPLTFENHQRAFILLFRLTQRCSFRLGGVEMLLGQTLVSSLYCHIVITVLRFCFGNRQLMKMFGTTCHADT